MFKLPLIVISTVLFGFIFTSANSDISFIDMDKVLISTKVGSSVVKQIIEIEKANSAEFKKKEEELKDKEAKIIAQKNILDSEEFKKKVSNLRSQINDYNLNRQKILKNINKKKIDNTKELLKLINPFLVKYSEDNSISIILQKKDIIVGKSNLDITNDVIKIIDKNISKFKIK
ncbi:OmpH family outer membrane protein [Candidatus Pelagibacter sp. Uisw_127]|uniref:OmpH family outer membrane protein n=1 Tax=Candidatus Pelagibacter sp. Uisw_127 TaxID=3230988 RepID=UPI0039EC80B3